MKTITPLTYKILALHEFPQIDTDDSIDWAIDLIKLGYENPVLYMLASFSKPTDYYEVIKYIDLAVQELGLCFKTGDDAITAYAYYHISQIAGKKDVRSNLKVLMELWKRTGYMAIYDFYLLNFAWEDVDYYRDGTNNYWPGAQPNTINAIVIAKQKSGWLSMDLV